MFIKSSHTFREEWNNWIFSQTWLHVSCAGFKKSWKRIFSLHVFIIKSPCTSSQHNTYYWCITFLSTLSYIYKTSIHIYIMFSHIFMEDFPLKAIFCGRMEIWNDDQPINFLITFTNPSIFEIFIYLRLVSWTFFAPNKMNFLVSLFFPFFSTWKNPS